MNPDLKKTLDTFFYPESIVVIGVSLKKINLGKIIVINNIQRGYKGRIYGVGGEKGQVEGAPVFESLLDLPETPDVAIIITPAQTVPGFIRQCAEKEIRHVVIETGGFSEFSRGKETLEQEVLAIARATGIRVIGPNCVGVGTAETGMMNAFGLFAREEKPSNISIISQSGGIGNTFIRILNDNHLFWQKFASVGNKLDLDEVDFLEYYLDDPRTSIIMCYLEGFNRGRAFFDRAMGSGKPIIVLKSNRSAASSNIARSHTTALTTSDDVVDAAFKQSAVIRVEGEDDLKTAAKAFKLPVIRGNNVAVLSRSGGHAVITADACAHYGLNMIGFPAEYIEKLKTIYTTRVIHHQNPLDLGEIFDYTIFISIVEETLKLGDIDGIIFNHLYQPSYEAASSRSFLKAVEEMVHRYDKPVYISLTSNAEEILDIAKNHSYPTFSSPIQAVQACALSLKYLRARKARDTRGAPANQVINHGAIDDILAQCAAEGRAPLTDEALELCRAAGLGHVRQTRIADARAVDSLDLDYPVAVKLLSRDASHKSDIGGVAVNVQGARELREAMTAMVQRLNGNDRDVRAEGFLIQEMAPAGEEFFIGARRDATFGPVVMVGYGGIYIELLHDVSMRLAPITENEAEAMIDELAMGRLFEGLRGSPPLDKPAMVAALCAVSERRFCQCIRNVEQCRKPLFY
jgi:acetyltransferase